MPTKQAWVLGNINIIYMMIHICFLSICYKLQHPTQGIKQSTFFCLCVANAFFFSLFFFFYCQIRCAHVAFSGYFHDPIKPARLSGLICQLHELCLRFQISRRYFLAFWGKGMDMKPHSTALRENGPWLSAEIPPTRYSSPWHLWHGEMRVPHCTPHVHIGACKTSQPNLYNLVIHPPDTQLPRFSWDPAN